MTVTASEPLAHLAAETDGTALFFRGNAVVLDGAGLLILGAPGTGKSGLSLALMALGARLVCDDGVWVAPAEAGPVLRRPDSAPPMIEARGIGLLDAGPICLEAPLRLLVDLDRAEPDRLPPRRIVTFGNAALEVILGSGQPMLAPALVHLMRHGRAAP